MSVLADIQGWNIGVASKWKHSIWTTQKLFFLSQRDIFSMSSTSVFEIKWHSQLTQGRTSCFCLFAVVFRNKSFSAGIISYYYQLVPRCLKTFLFFMFSHLLQLSQNTLKKTWLSSFSHCWTIQYLISDQELGIRHQKDVERQKKKSQTWRQCFGYNREWFTSAKRRSQARGDPSGRNDVKANI